MNKVPIEVQPPPESRVETGSEAGAVARIPDRSGSAGWGREGRGLIAVLIGFVVVAVTVMIGGQLRKPREEPWRSAELIEAKADLVRDPKNEALKNRVRVLDQGLRQGYFRHLERNRRGAWLVFGGCVLLVVLAHRMTGAVGLLSRQDPSKWTADGGEAAGSVGRATGIEPPFLRGAWVAPDRDRTRLLAGRTLFATSAFVVFGMGLAGGFWRVTLPDRTMGADSRESVEVATRIGGAVEDARAGGSHRHELAANWPRFRGFDGSGRVASTVGGDDVPLTWDLKSGEGVLWRASIGLKGYSSPVVWKDRVFVTGGDRSQRRVFAFDATTGSNLWARAVTPVEAGDRAIEPPDQSGQAASTPATDGARVYAIFGTGELGALDYSGALIWHQRLDLSENGYGHASSLVVENGTLFVQADQGDPEEGKSVLLAIEASTGRTRWMAKRPVGASWATPMLFETGGRWQVVTAGNPWLMAHDAESGTELWRARVLGGELAPSPVFGDGRLFAASPGQALLALATDRTGDITTSGVVWTLEEEVPDVPTPVVVDDLLFTANTEGLVICREAGSGSKIWEHAFELEIQASPLVVGRRLYLFGQPGGVRVLTVGREFELLAEFEMEEDVFATPAVASGRFYLRSDRFLTCVGAPGGEPGERRPDVL
ncbi:MAG: PQQ-binding-like beta-propeller repeat protein [Limisphaerales bacterium]